MAVESQAKQSRNVVVITALASQMNFSS